ncbi:hypothetical protein PLICRDRAFT_177549 [Plicaturopsis crispa FD-325 SS-3]|nr:hypothetical protein PLICRDRAFT_177549 [Plicaturopsis crispa FD-325 SS-3]
MPSSTSIGLSFLPVACCAILSVRGAFLQPSTTNCPGSRNAVCCKWFNVLYDVQNNLFDGGVCGQDARSSIRLMFHDSVGLSKSLWSSGSFGGGGADGSIIKYSTTELAYTANIGLQDIVNALQSTADAHNVSYGDIIQFAGAIALTNCPGAPRIQFLAGRPDATAPAPPSTIAPAPFYTVDQILDRMADAGFSPDDTVALLASHSIGTQQTTDPTVPGAPFDSTPEVFDNQFYLEMLLKGKTYPGSGNNQGEVKAPIHGQFRLQSDEAIARAPQTACKWASFAHDSHAMVDAFRDAMAKVANNGQNISELVDCSEVIPEGAGWKTPATLPAGHTVLDVEDSCEESALPLPL